MEQMNQCTFSLAALAALAAGGMASGHNSFLPQRSGAGWLGKYILCAASGCGLGRPACAQGRERASERQRERAPTAPGAPRSPQPRLDNCGLRFAGGLSAFVGEPAGRDDLGTALTRCMGTAPSTRCVAKQGAAWAQGIRQLGRWNARSALTPLACSPMDLHAAGALSGRALGPYPFVRRLAGHGDCPERHRGGGQAAGRNENWATPLRMKVC